MKVAIVHDWLYGGGAERVVEQLHKLYPDAPIYTSYCSDEWRKKLDNKVVTGYLQYWPFNKLRKFIGPLRVFWFGSLDLSKYDLVISSSGNGEAKDINVPKTTKYICYCHAPTHYYWRSYDQYLKNPGLGIFNPIARIGLKVLFNPMKNRDFKAAQKPDFFIANSSFIQKEIKDYYKRDSVVIYPPVDIERFNKQDSTNNKKKEGFITVGRQVPLKHTELLIAACNELKENLTVVGRGPEHDNLVKIAGPTIKFITDASDNKVTELLNSAKAFLFASNEDFGIAPVEALAAGTPIIAYKSGGALDYVKPKVNGLFFDKQDKDSLINAIQEFNNMTFNEKVVKESAKEFSTASFRNRMEDFIKGVMK